MKFLKWMRSNENTSNEELLKYIDSRGKSFANISSKNESIDAINTDSNLSEEQKSKLIELMEKSWGAFESQSNIVNNEVVIKDKPERWKDQFFDNLPLFLMGFISFIAIVVLAVILWPRNPLLELLGKAEIARGLITFIFAFGVIFVTLILIVTLFSSEDPEIGNKFDKAKELFTALIAVLGTILGFYFGQAGSSIETAGITNASEISEGIASILGSDISADEKLQAIQDAVADQ